jgi:hypothetical protein
VVNALCFWLCASLLKGFRSVGFLVGILRLDSVQHRFVAAVRAYFRQPQSRLTTES